MNQNEIRIIAHRGVPGPGRPENSLPAFEAALELGANAVEMDVRLTKDMIPVVYHYYYMDLITDLLHPIFEYDYAQLAEVDLIDKDGDPCYGIHISTLNEVLESLGGRIGLEIEIKGPEPEAAPLICNIISRYQSEWGDWEVTSYHPEILHQVQKLCPGIATDILFPRSEDWMGLDVARYAAYQLGRRAHARAIHLHPSQLSIETVDWIRSKGFEVHAWDVNSVEQLEKVLALRIEQICTDRLAFVQTLLKKS